MIYNFAYHTVISASAIFDAAIVESCILTLWLNEEARHQLELERWYSRQMKIEMAGVCIYKQRTRVFKMYIQDL